MVCFSNVDFTHGCLIYMTPYVQQLYTRDPLTLLEIESHSQGVLRLSHCAISQAAMWFSICHYLTFRGWNFHVAQPIIFRWVCLIFCIIDELPFRPNRHEKDPSRANLTDSSLVWRRLSSKYSRVHCTLFCWYLNLSTVCNCGERRPVFSVIISRGWRLRFLCLLSLCRQYWTS